MTRAADVPGVRAADASEAVALLRRSGARVSTVRRLIIEALFRGDGPVSAAALAARLGLEESSVYRNLEMLEQHGLARHVHLGHGPGLYARVGKEDDDTCSASTAARSPCWRPMSSPPSGSNWSMGLDTVHASVISRSWGCVGTAHELHYHRVVPPLAVGVTLGQPHDADGPKARRS